MISRPIKAAWTRHRSLGFGLGLLVVISAAGGATAGERLDLRRLVEAARAENPQIRAADARVQAMLQRPSQEGTLPDPTVGVRWHNEEFDRITYGKSDFSFLEFSAEQEVPFPGKLGLRSRIAVQEARRETAMRDATVLMVLAETAVRYFDLAVTDRSIAILRQNLATLELMIQQARESYGVGIVAQQDVLRATLERGALQERATRLEQRRVAAEAGLNALLNRAAATPVPPTEWSDTAAVLEPLAELSGRLTARAPELRAAQEAVQKTDEMLALARREYYPDFAIMGGYTNKRDLFPEWEVGLRVRVPLYFWRRQRAGVAEATFAKSAAEHERQNVRVSLDGRLRELHSMADSALRLVRLYRDALIPQAALTLESARASYAVGKVDFLTALNAFTALLGYQMGYAEQLGDLGRARAEIGPLVGESPLDWWGRR